jgi:hypothetical protein
VVCSLCRSTSGGMVCVDAYNIERSSSGEGKKRNGSVRETVLAAHPFRFEPAARLAAAGNGGSIAVGWSPPSGTARISAVGQQTS